jgi:polyhydroxybutyrate depolymerase
MGWESARLGALLVFAPCVSCERAEPARSTLEPPGYVAFAKEPVPPPPEAPTTAGACVSSLTAGRHELEHGGRARAFVVDLPAEPAPAGPRPLLFAFHGWGGDPEQLEGTTRIASTASSRGYVVVRPYGFNKSFDAGACCGLASELRVDDVGLVRALVAKLEAEACIDRRRVYATGFSNGGFLAHRLGCEAADLFAAVASVAGTLGMPRCAPARPVSVLQIHGKADGIVPFAGNSAKGWRSVASTIDEWTRALRCPPDAAAESYANGGARCATNPACDGGSEVTLCRIEEAAHTWPGGPRSTGFGGSKALDATGTILAFFERHAREATGAPLDGPSPGDEHNP